MERMRSDMTLQELTGKKTGTAGKALPSHGGFCYFQIRFCFNVTSTLPNFKSFFSRNSGQAPGPSIWWSHRPKNLGSPLLLKGTNQETLATGDPLAAGDPLTTLLNLLLGNSLQCLSPLPGKPLGLVLLGISPGPPRQNRTALSDAAPWQAGNAHKEVLHLEKMRKAEIRAVSLTSSSLPSRISCPLLRWQG